MKKMILLVFLLVSVSTVFAQVDSVDVADNQSAVVYFYRLNNYVGSAVKMKILVNDEPVILLRNGSYYAYNAAPGEYLFSCSMGSESRLKLKLEAGNTYFIKCYFTSGFWSAQPQMELMNAESGQAIIEGGQLSALEYEEITTIKPKSRIGLTFGFGGGFERIPLFYDENNNDVNLSTGGGFNVGVKYGYEFAKHFDLSANCSYQSGSLTPALKNASASFRRMVVTLTPALIIPIKNNDYLRFKLGAGPGYYGFGTMDIDASKAGGDIMKFKYKPQLGLHASTVFEANFSDRGSMSMELKYYHVNYAYTEEGSTHYPGIVKIDTPDGSGFDFIVGYYYHF